MAEQWEIDFAPNVIDDLEAHCENPLDAVLVHEWLLAMERRLQESGGNPADSFLARTSPPPALGTVVEGRLLGLFSHHRFPYRTWRNAWLRPRERLVISVHWLTLLDV